MQLRHAETQTPILPALQQRWSPRSFHPERELVEHQLLPAFEAARWSPSASNTQPWRFIVGYRDDATFRAILQSLVEGNQSWAHRASALVVNVTETHGPDGKERRWAEYDLGQAVAHFSIQAHADGFHVHQVGGFDPASITQNFQLEPHLRPVSVTVIGHVDSPDQLTESQRDRETTPRTRLDLDTLLLP